MLWTSALSPAEAQGKEAALQPTCSYRQLHLGLRNTTPTQAPPRACLPDLRCPSAVQRPYACAAAAYGAKTVGQQQQGLGLQPLHPPHLLQQRLFCIFLDGAGLASLRRTCKAGKAAADQHITTLRIPEGWQGTSALPGGSAR